MRDVFVRLDCVVGIPKFQISHKADVGMRNLMALIALTTLASCGPGAPEHERRSSPKKPDAAAESGRKKAEAIRSALIRKGQGCPGQVLKGRELADAVMNKVDLGPAIQPMPLVYFSDGHLELSDGTPQNVTPGRYRIAGDQLCHNLSGNNGNLSWCLRLIKVDNLSIMQETLPSQVSGPPRLECFPFKLIDRVIK